MSESIKNAIIKGATITNDDHDCLMASLHLDYGGAGQSFGGWVLYLPTTFKHHELKSVAGHFIFRVMEIAGVTTWDALKGQTIRVDADNAKVKRIGHIIKDDWFDPAIDFSEVE